MRILFFHAFSLILVTPLLLHSQHLLPPSSGLPQSAAISDPHAKTVSPPAKVAPDQALYSIVWTGAEGDNQWNTPGNWDQNRVPGASDDVLTFGGGINGIPAAVRSLDVAAPGLTINSSIDITSYLIVENAATVSGNFTNISIGGDAFINGILMPGGLNQVITCKGSFLPGTIASFVPGTSTVILENAGPFCFTCNQFHGQFYGLSVNGFNKTSVGNVLVSGECSLNNDVYLRSTDTLFIQDSTAAKLAGTGYVIDGAVSRAILAGSLDPYRFESESTYVRFDGTGTYPSKVVLRTHPFESFNPCSVRWTPVESSIDTATNTISADSIHDFSKWAIGVIRPGSTVPVIQRYYEIGTTENGSFTSELSLHYEPGEVPPGTPEDSLVILRSEAITTTTNVDYGWDLLSIPNTRDTCDLVADFFPGAVSNAFTYDQNIGAYQVRDSLVNGAGYWLKFPFSGPQQILGEEIMVDTIPVSPGWNMIGTLSGRVSSSAVSSIPPGLISGSFFGYSGSYVDASSLEPGKGYWVKINSPGGQLVLNSLSSAELNSAPATNFMDVNELKIQDSRGHSQTLYFSRKAGSMNLARYDLPPLPPTGGFDARFSTQRMAGILGGNNSKDLGVVTSSAALPVTVSWSVRDKEQYFLLDGEKNMPISKTGKYLLLGSEFTLRSSNESGAAIPVEFALAQNYPNPFNPITIIKYQLPVQSRVTLRVYNILGQVVATLVDGIQEAGYESANFDAGNLASGVYYYKIESTGVDDSRRSFSDVRKMIVIR